jgi:RNA 3'-terminal phosphate cyclase (ATP)
VNAIATITGAEVEGAALGSRRLVLRPGPVRPGDYHFSIGSAGSASLVLQTVLWPLLLADAPSRVVVEGGTHNSMSPPFDFLARTFLPVLARMGARVELTLDRHGFYPAGGGRMVCAITPCAALQPLDLVERGRLVATRARALVANLPISIAHRELDTLRGKLALSDAEPRSVIAMGPGNVVLIELEHEHVTEVVTGFGEKGTAAEVVARRAAKEAIRYLAADAPVGEHLADQLIIPQALAGRGTFRTGPLSLHTRTNIDVVSAFLPVQLDVIHNASETIRVTARTVPDPHRVTTSSKSKRPTP